MKWYGARKHYVMQAVHRTTVNSCVYFSKN